jgi:hypothetical protein
MTQTLPRSHCKQSTRHALLRDHDAEQHRDAAENWQHLEAGAGVPPVRHLPRVYGTD